MSRIRSIHPGLFTDESFMSLSMAARVLLVGLWTEADDHGVFEWKPLTLKARILPADNADVAAILGELEAANVVRRENALGLIRNFCKFQRPKKPHYKLPFQDEWGTYLCFKPPGTEPVPHQGGTGGVKPSLMEDVIGGKEEEEEKKKAIRLVGKPTQPKPDDDFEVFWKAYPNRGTATNPKKPARKLFLQAVRNGTNPQTIIAAVRAGVGLDQTKTGTEYTPQAVKWLRDQRWEDAPVLSLAEPAGVYIVPGSKEWDAWARHRGKPLPTDRNGGWRVSSPWPPGFQLEAAE